jgi:hypothetical protein
MQKMFVIHYYINKQILDSYLHTKSEKIWSLFTFVLNWVFLQFPWQQQAFWNFQASKPFIHMPYNISIKFHSIPSTLNFSRFFVATAAILKFLSLKIIHTHVRQNFWKVSSNSEHHSKPTMTINSQHHNLLGNQISPKSEDFCIWQPFYTLVTMATATILIFFNPPQKLPHTTKDIPTKWIIIWLPNHGYHQFPTSKSTWKPNFAQIGRFLYLAAILYLGYHGNGRTLRWIFIQSFMKFDERNPNFF